MDARRFCPKGGWWQEQNPRTGLPLGEPARLGIDPPAGGPDDQRLALAFPPAASAFELRLPRRTFQLKPVASLM